MARLARFANNHPDEGQNQYCAGADLPLAWPGRMRQRAYLASSWLPLSRRLLRRAHTSSALTGQVVVGATGPDRPIRANGNLQAMRKCRGDDLFFVDVFASVAHLLLLADADSERVSLLPPQPPQLVRLASRRVWLVLGAAASQSINQLSSAAQVWRRKRLDCNAPQLETVWDSSFVARDDDDEFIILAGDDDKLCVERLERE